MARISNSEVVVEAMPFESPVGYSSEESWRLAAPKSRMALRQIPRPPIGTYFLSNAERDDRTTHIIKVTRIGAAGSKYNAMCGAFRLDYGCAITKGPICTTCREAFRQAIRLTPTDRHLLYVLGPDRARATSRTVAGMRAADEANRHRPPAYVVIYCMSMARIDAEFPEMTAEKITEALHTQATMDDMFTAPVRPSSSTHLGTFTLDHTGRPVRVDPIEPDPTGGAIRQPLISSTAMRAPSPLQIDFVAAALPQQVRHLIGGGSNNILRERLYSILTGRPQELPDGSAIGLVAPGLLAHVYRTPDGVTARDEYPFRIVPTPPNAHIPNNTYTNAYITGNGTGAVISDPMAPAPPRDPSPVQAPNPYQQYISPDAPILEAQASQLGPLGRAVRGMTLDEQVRLLEGRFAASLGAPADVVRGPDYGEALSIMNAALDDTADLPPLEPTPPLPVDVVSDNPDDEVDGDDEGHHHL